MARRSPVSKAEQPLNALNRIPLRHRSVLHLNDLMKPAQYEKIVQKPQKCAAFLRLLPGFSHYNASPASFSLTLWLNEAYDFTPRMSRSCHPLYIDGSLLDTQGGLACLCPLETTYGHGKPDTNSNVYRLDPFREQSLDQHTFITLQILCWTCLIILSAKYAGSSERRFTNILQKSESQLRATEVVLIERS